MHRAVAGAAWRASGGAAESPITYGNGLENALHEMTNQELGMKSYFYKSRRSWEKGSIGNRNGILRRYFPKGQDWRLTIQKDPDRVIRRIMRHR
jgi:IS30 family transposase